MLSSQGMLSCTVTVSGTVRRARPPQPPPPPPPLSVVFASVAVTPVLANQ